MSWLQRKPSYPFLIISNYPDWKPAIILNSEQCFDSYIHARRWRSNSTLKMFTHNCHNIMQCICAFSRLGYQPVCYTKKCWNVEMQNLLSWPSVIQFIMLFVSFSRHFVIVEICSFCGLTILTFKLVLEVCWDTKLRLVSSSTKTPKWVLLRSTTKWPLGPQPVKMNNHKCLQYNCQTSLMIALRVWKVNL
jgi:hypothetical protein